MVKIRQSELLLVTKDEFLRDPVRVLWAEDQDVPIEWIREAWAIEAFRDNATYEMVRSVRKNGDFFIAGYWLAVLPAILTEDQVVDLYVSIRDQAHRVEDEWRPGFEVAFRRFADKLPPVG
jgi:hypothetical protein